MKLTMPHIAQLYQRIQIETAGKGKLVTILHEKCVSLIREAFLQSEKNRRETLDKAQNILALLQRSLRIEDEVSQSIFYIYDYAYILVEHGSPEDCQKALQVFCFVSDTLGRILRRKN
jgi:flagellar biosynthetic protein FliS